LKATIAWKYKRIFNKFCGKPKDKLYVALINLCKPNTVNKIYYQFLTLKSLAVGDEKAAHVMFLLCAVFRAKLLHKD